MDSADPIQEILGQGGTLAGCMEGFESRPSQVTLARLIHEAIGKRMNALAEAGTGTGKTMGYLVPILLSGKKTVISTGTKNLQEQIFYKDIPLLSKAIGLKIDAMLMKGRRNYLCLHRYHQFFSQIPLLEEGSLMVRERIEKWLESTEFADRSELSWMRDDDPLWDALSSTSEQCLGAECPRFEECYLSALRRQAAQAPIVIVNHHLFFADLMVKKGGYGEVIPRFQVVVFDEAHDLEEIATTYLGARVSTLQIQELVEDVEKAMHPFPDAGRKEVRGHLDCIRAGIEGILDFFHWLGEKGQLHRDTLHRIYHEHVRIVLDGLGRLQDASALQGSEEGRAGLLSGRAGEMKQGLEKIFSLHDPNLLIWYEMRRRSVAFHASPLDVSRDMRECLYEKVKTIIFTSATLSTNGNFEYFRSRLGIYDPVLQGIYPSHFDFKRQTILYVPRDLPPPRDPQFAGRVAERIQEILRITSGRALVLFTSYQNMDQAHEFLKGKLPFHVFKQGDAPKSILLNKFREDIHSVLLATGSFWQGVDVPGEALSCLIIDKLPFDSPGEPLVAARIDSIRTRGGNPFMDYQLPSAIIALKQGLGRLIRKGSDRGVLCIMDNRIITSRYGQFFFKSIPEIPLSTDLEEISRFFAISH